MHKERRSEKRQKANAYHAEIWLVGVPVYDVIIKDLSANGASVFIKEDSLLMKYLEIGRTAAIRYFLESREKPSKMYEATIKHITIIEEGLFKGHYSVGFEILN